MRSGRAPATVTCRSRTGTLPCSYSRPARFVTGTFSGASPAAHGPLRADPRRWLAKATPGPATEPWGLIEMWIEDPDGVPIMLVEVPADLPLRRDPRSASPAT